MKKSICPACNKSGAPDAIYCSKCGTEINPQRNAYFCIRCGQTLDDEANYCAYCREPVPFTSTEENNKRNITGNRHDLCIISFAIKK